jgi:hypothetical protein
MSGRVPVPVYLQIEPEYNYLDQVVGGKVVRQTRNRPDRPVTGAYVVKLSLRVPADVFERPVPEVVVLVPEADELPMITVAVEDVEPE